MIIYSPTFTGSVQITGSQTVTGDLTVQGNLTAQTFILSSSVSYFTESFASGSTRFGDSMDDTMKVTGSLLLTGSMLINTVTAQNAASNRGNLTINGATSILTLATGDTNAGYLYHGGTDLLLVNAKNGAMQFYTNDTERMRITSGGNLQLTGSANFSSTITTAGDITIKKASAASFIADNTSASGKSYRLVSTDAGTFIIQNTGIADLVTITSAGAVSAGAATFSGKVIGNGFNSFSGDVSITSGASSTIYTMGDNGLYTVQIIVSAGSLIYSAAAIFYAHSSNAQFVKALDLYDGANVTLDNSGSGIRITNNGFATFTWSWIVLYQRF